MSAKPTAAAPAKEPVKSKLVLIGAIVLALIVLAVAAFLFLQSRNHDDERGARSASSAVPTFLPLETMVVNLADPGGDRFAQIGITLELQDDKTVSVIKQYLPSIRNGVLMLVSQRSSEELLLREGKEKLAADIREEVSRPLGLAASKRPRVDEDLDEEEAPRRQNAVRRVLFSSFIVQ